MFRTPSRRAGWCAALGASLALLAHAAEVPATEPETPTFDILEFDVDGNSVLPVLAIERAVTPFLGEKRQMGSVDAAREALEKAYQGAGYLTVLVDVPEQRIEDGVVHLHVVEGRVDRLKVTGSRYFSQGYIREKVPSLGDGKVPNFNDVQRELAAVNRTEDRRVQPIMRAGATPGTVETELKVKDRLPLHGTVEVNDRAAAQTRPLRLGLTVRYENLWQLDHSLSFTYLTAPQDTAQSRVATLNYTVPSDDAAWVAYAIYSDSSVAAIGDVNVLGKGTTLGLRYVRPLAGGPDEVHSLSYGVDYKDLKQDTRQADNVVSTPLRYLPLQFAYTGTFDHGPRRQTQVGLQTTASLRPVLRREVACPGSSGSNDQFACQRQGGDGGFATLRGDLRQSLPLGESGGSLNLRLNGQVATGPLPNAEQFTIGGAETVRGYHEAEGAGDHGVLGSVEWRSMDIGASVSRWFGAAAAAGQVAALSQTYALAFADAGRAYVSDPAAGQAPWVSLAGVGVGLRTKVRTQLNGEFDLAWPLKSTQASAARSPRAHVKLALDF